MKHPLEPPIPDFVREALASDERDLESDRLLAESLSALGPVQAAPTSAGRARLLDAVRLPPLRHAPFFDRLSTLFDMSVEEVTAMLTRSTDVQAWEGAMPGVELLHFQGGPKTAGSDCGLVRVAAGLAFPRHRHLGVERALILEGGYRDDSGHLFQAGDLAVMDPGTSHAYVVLPDGPLLFALLLEHGLEGGLRFEA
jgi:quercetin dioxygenase-like cupin family protein